MFGPIEILIGLAGLIFGIYFGVKTGKYAAKDDGVKEFMKLPPYWMVYDLSQDIITGAWNLAVVSIHDKDDNGTARTVVYNDALSPLEAFDGVRSSIENENYFVVPQEETSTGLRYIKDTDLTKDQIERLKESEKDADEVIDGFFKDIADNWEEWCDNDGRGILDVDFPPSPGNVSFGLLIDVLRSRISG